MMADPKYHGVLYPGSLSSFMWVPAQEVCRTGPSLAQTEPNTNSQMGTTVPVRISSHIVEHGVLVSNIGEVIRFKRYHNSSLAYVTSMPSLVS